MSVPTVAGENAGKNAKNSALTRALRCGALLCKLFETCSNQTNFPLVLLTAFSVLTFVNRPPIYPAGHSKICRSRRSKPRLRGAARRGFLSELSAYVDPGGERWLILSDLAKHLGLRSRANLLAHIEQAGLFVNDRIDLRPNHPRTTDRDEPLHTARAAEIASLWRLASY